MPLLMCPNDNASMTSVSRSGVEFDMCPVCRGVWLDRGELEKLIAADGPTRPASPERYDDRRAPSHREGDWDRHYPRKKKRLDIFDIFD